MNDEILKELTWLAKRNHCTLQELTARISDWQAAQVKPAPKSVPGTDLPAEVFKLKGEK